MEWINFDEWNRLKVWRSYRELRMINQHLEEKEFNDLYKEKYPENSKILNLE